MFWKWTVLDGVCAVLALLSAYLFTLYQQPASNVVTAVSYCSHNSTLTILDSISSY